MTRCDLCSYNWQGEDEEYVRCHYEGNDEWAPCNYDENEDYEEIAGQYYDS